MDEVILYYVSCHKYSVRPVGTYASGAEA